VDDNPYLAQTGYRAVLQGLPEPLRSQLLFGDFAIGVSDDEWQVIPTKWVELAQDRWRQRTPPEGSLTSLGADVARGGKDSTVLSPIITNYLFPQLKYAGKDTPDGQTVAAKILTAPQLSPNTLVNIDVIGVGASAYDFTRAQHHNTFAFNGAATNPKATDEAGVLHFANLRAQAYWHMREILDPASGEDIALPPDPVLLADLTAPRWSPRPRGVLVEDKEDIKERIGRSPDLGDSCVYGFFQPYISNQGIFDLYVSGAERLAREREERERERQDSNGT
jgi:hypothetical protein